MTLLTKNISFEIKQEQNANNESYESVYFFQHLSESG